MSTKDDRNIYIMSTSLTYIFYYSARDVLKFGQGRMVRFYGNMVELKERWSRNEITTKEMLNYCNSKGIDVYKFVKSIPNDKKLKMAGGKPSAEALRFIEAAMMANIMFACITLKETFKTSTNKINEFLNKVADHIDSYTKKQPKCKLYYLCDEMIIEALIDEIKLDIKNGVTL